MKRIIITLIINLSSALLYANQLSTLNLTMADHANYEIIFNNQFFGNNGSNFLMSNIIPGRYPLTLAKIIPGQWGLQKKVIYNGVIDIPACSNVNALVDCFYRLQLTYLPIVYTNPYTPDHCTTTATGYYQPMPMGMNPVSFSQLKNTINNQWFESGKLMVAKQAIMSNNITSAQVAELMQLFSFESSKLEIAKLAFANTIDKQNYYIVNNEFWFSSSVGELNQFISRM